MLEREYLTEPSTFSRSDNAFRFLLFLLRHFSFTLPSS
jgi:hypothetical protein